MRFISEDVTYLAGGLGILALLFLIALRSTQQGKYLTYAGIAFALALLLVVIERVWVTDAERIEAVVYELRDAVANSDAPAAIALLAPDVEYVQQSQNLSEVETHALITRELGRARFDFVRITKLETNAGSQSRRGSAIFRVMASGTYVIGVIPFNFTGTSLDFSLGFRETSPNVWRVSRITLTRAPREVRNLGIQSGTPKPSLPRLQDAF